MLSWLADPEDRRKPVYDGTITALITCYQTDEKSPYRGLAQNAQRGYDDWCRTLERVIGKRRVDRLTGQLAGLLPPVVGACSSWWDAAGASRPGVCAQCHALEHLSNFETAGKTKLSAVMEKNG
jgi:hypothetical protein